MTRGPSSVRPVRRLLLVELVGVVGDEVAGLPVAVEHGGELVDDVGVAGGRGPDVPLEPGDLRRVGEVRRADVGGREAGAPVEDPRLGVEAGAAEVVGDPDLGAEVGELVEGPALGGAGVGRGEDPERLARPRSGGGGASSSGAMPLRRMKAMTTSMASADSISERSWLHRPRLAGRVGEQRGVEQRDERLRRSAAAMPSGRRRGWRAGPAPGRPAARCGSAVTSSPSRSRSCRATWTPTATRSSSLTSASARSICRLRCQAIRSGASALR